jgi:integrase
MISARAIHINVLGAEKLLDRLGSVSKLTEQGTRDWLDKRSEEVASKTVNLEMDVLRQLCDLCQRLGWRPDNPAGAVNKLPWKLSRLPLALTFVQVQRVLQVAHQLATEAPLRSLAGQCERLLIAGIYLGLRRGELQPLLWSDTNGRQVFIQGKTLPDGQPWEPKGHEARVITYSGIERPIAVFFGEEPEAGYASSPAKDRSPPFHADSLTAAMEGVLKPLIPALSLHSLRHTLATWRLEMGEPMIRVQNLMGHADANTRLRYAHVQVDPMADLLPLLL